MCVHDAVRCYISWCRKSWFDHFPEFSATTRSECFFAGGNNSRGEAKSAMMSSVVGSLERSSDRAPTLFRSFIQRSLRDSLCCCDSGRHDTGCAQSFNRNWQDGWAVRFRREKSLAIFLSDLPFVRYLTISPNQSDAVMRPSGRVKRPSGLAGHKSLNIQRTKRRREKCKRTFLSGFSRSKNSENLSLEFRKF